jgi:hypothetical protein
MRNEPMARGHASPELINFYVRGDTGTSADLVWGLETHLESCAVCRLRLADAVAEQDPSTMTLLDRVWAEVEPEIAAGTPTPARPRWKQRLATWASPVMLPWLAMTILVTLSATALDLVAMSTRPSYPSLVLLLAPVMPLLGVVASWAKGMDPAHELIAATARAGLHLVLRRTVAVLVVVIPVLTVAGWVVGASPVRWLLPCLAFTVATLALGGVIGVSRAAVALAAAWAGLVVAPSLTTAHLPVVLQPASLPVWGLLVVVGLLVVAKRNQAFGLLNSQR